VVAGAHRSTTADVIWLRTLPDLYRDFADLDAKARWIDGSLEAITNLEPSFMTVYDFGQAYFTTRERTKQGAVDRAIRLLEKGIRLNPEVSGLRVRLAMVHYIEKHDPEKAREILEEAAKLPGFDFLSAQMLSSLRSEVHQDLIDIAWWVDLMETGPREGRSLAELNLWRAKARIAARAAREFTEATGRKPSSPADLATPEYVQAGVVPVIAEGLEIDGEGRPSYPRLDELEREDAVRAAEAWCLKFRDEKGRWPTLEDFASVGFRLPPPPAGKRWSVDGGRVELAAE